MIITISREYGSGGRFVGRKLAEELEIPFYDREIVLAAAQKSGLAPEFIETADEQKPRSLLFDISTSFYGNGGVYDPAPADKAFFAQTEAIREFAASGSCVIVGRCADYILKDTPTLFRVFIHAAREDRVMHIIKYYNIDPAKADAYLSRIDRKRSSYRRFYTGNAWDMASPFDLTINMSTFDIDEAVAIIKAAALAPKRAK